ncbi:MAG: hypothetical protein O3B24_05270 [Verrucomicrobia bacterium]|nr:hypothetical protein [Verrucomicrobiota bacterium]
MLMLLGYDVKSLTAAETPGYRVVKREPGAPLLVEKIPEQETPPNDPFEAIRVVEIAIGLYIDGAQHLDNIPRPSDYRVAFQPVGRSAFKLLNTIKEWSNYYREQITKRGKNICEMERALEALVEVSAAVLREMGGKSSKGAGKKFALIEVIRWLRLAFRNHYQGKSSAMKRTEREFVEFALLAGKIISEDYDGLSKLLRDPRAA